MALAMTWLSSLVLSPSGGHSHLGKEVQLSVRLHVGPGPRERISTYLGGRSHPEHPSDALLPLSTLSIPNTQLWPQRALDPAHGQLISLKAKWPSLKVSEAGL